MYLVVVACLALNVSFEKKKKILNTIFRLNLIDILQSKEFLFKAAIVISMDLCILERLTS